MAKDVKPHCLDFNNGLFVSEEDHRELVSKTQPKRGDLLVVNIGAGSGTPAIVDVDFPFSFKNVAILNRPDEIDSEYLFTFLLATQTATFEELTQGGAQPFLSLARLRSKPFPLPPLSEQKRIVSKVTDLVSQVTRLESTLTCKFNRTQHSALLIPTNSLSATRPAESQPPVLPTADAPGIDIRTTASALSCRSRKTCYTFASGSTGDDSRTIPTRT
jgi:hypothetical protein